MSDFDKRQAEKPFAPEDGERKDGQAATNESVFDNLADDAWFPALYASQFMNDGFGPDMPEV